MWKYNNECFTDELIPESAVGFVYEISDLVNNKKYIGKKLFTKSKSYQKNKKKKRKRVASNWESYYGSNVELQEQVKLHGSEKFEKNILRICYSKSELNYYETKMIFQTDALLRNDYYNSWVSARINSNTLINMMNKNT